MSVSKSREFILLGDKLIEETARALHLTWNDEEMLCQDENGKLIGWNDEFALPISIENSSICQICFWGDGTLEVMFKGNEESYNWYDLNDTTIKDLIKALRKIK